MTEAKKGLRLRALDFWNFGFNPIAFGRINRDTGKHDPKQTAGKWKVFQDTPMNMADVNSQPWDSPTTTGIGLLHGIGNIRCLDFDGGKVDGVKQPFPEDIVQEVCRRLEVDWNEYEWLVRSGSGGYHLWFLAEDLPADLFGGEAKNKVVFTPAPEYVGKFDQVELRWNRHATLVPPSTNEQGEYVFMNCDYPECPPDRIEARKVLEALSGFCDQYQGQGDSGNRLPELRATPQDGVRANGHNPSKGRPKGVDGFDVETVRSMLDKIPKQQEHVLWKKVVAAVVDAVGKDAAVDVLEEWSPITDGGTPYRVIVETGLQRITAGTLVHIARQHGWNGKVKITKAELVQGFLLDSFELRFNELRRQVEYRLHGSDSWIMAGDRTFEQWAVTFEKIHKEAVHPEKIRLYAQDTDICTAYDPIRLFFDTLPEADGEDHITKLASTVTLADEDKRELFILHLKKWLVGAFVCGYYGGKQGNKNELFFILQGGQGVGKTTFLRALVPADLEEYKCEHVDTATGVDAFSLLSKSFICIDEELSAMSKKDTETLKRLLSDDHYLYRAKYGRVEARYERRVSFCGSVNNVEFLRDTTGSRRFLVHTITALDRILHATVDNLQVWAQAKALHGSGFKHYLTGSEAKDVEFLNKSFEVQDYEEEVLLRYYRPTIGKESGDWFTASELAEQLAKLHDEANTESRAGSYNGNIHDHRNAVSRLKTDTRFVNKLGALLAKNGFVHKSVKKYGEARKRYLVKRRELPFSDPTESADEVPF